MKIILTLLSLALVATAHAGPGAHGPNGEHLDAPSVSTPDGLARLPDGSVNVPMLAQRRLGLRTLLAVESDAAATVELPARVVMDPNSAGRVQTLIGGKVEPGPKGLPIAGQRVRRGDVLGYVAHHVDPLAAASQQAQLAELRSSRQLAEQRVQRLQSLEGTVPRKEIDAAKLELDSYTARENAIGASLGSKERLVAPVSGVIARADVVNGQVVESKDVLFEVIDPARMLIEASVADVKLSTQLAGATLAGIADWKLQFLGAAGALRDGTLPLTFKATGTGATPLAIGQPVTVVAALTNKVKGIVLPAQAVTRNSANETVVWIKAGAERYIPQPVQVRPLDAQTVVITQGLGADNRVVVQGAPLIAQIR